MDVSELAHRRLFDSLDKDRDGSIWAWELLSPLGRAGIQPGDPRIRSALTGLRDPDGRPLGIDSQPVQIDYQQFTQIAEHSSGLVRRALEGKLAVSPSEFMDLTRGLERIHADLLDDRRGAVADYIPTLRDADPEKFGIAICTADGQTFSIGDADLEFSVQSTSKPFSYAMALEELGPQEVHEWVGQEQSGGSFNDRTLSLNAAGKPQNPMINAGAIGTLALVDAGSEVSDRFATVQQTWTMMMGQRPGYDNATFLAERDTGHGNRGLASQMANAGKLKGGLDGRDAPADTAEFYFMVCSLGVDAQRLAAAGATLANGGVAPYSGERVFSQETAGRVLSVMGHSGMYDGSGRFADDVGLPAKSGVSGNVLMVVPEKRLAVVTFSPRLDEAGNSVRGVEVCRRLVNEFGLHPYKGLGAERGRDSVQSDADRKAATAEAIRQALGGTSGGGRVSVPQSANAREAGNPGVRRSGRQSGGQQL
ncbi:L-glutaminase [Kribbella steppae]|uniref:Glutaminase n=1 Tax=Kribbella steppae TaxID=2512223 RepID=A0A4R2H1D4_9ACTN|nr:glutaminase A [Kribbella steppae]TCO18496.1 L-glutaminase [Kribbella steppae]